MATAAAAAAVADADEGGDNTSTSTNLEWHFLHAMALLQQQQQEEDETATPTMWPLPAYSPRTSAQGAAATAAVHASLSRCLALLPTTDNDDGPSVPTRTAAIRCSLDDPRYLAYCAHLEMGRLHESESAPSLPSVAAAAHYARAAAAVAGATGGVLRGAEARFLEAVALQMHANDFAGTERALRASVAAAAAAAVVGQGEGGKGKKAKKGSKKRRRREGVDDDDDDEEGEDGDCAGEEEEDRVREAEAGRQARLRLALLLLQKNGESSGSSGALGGAAAALEALEGDAACEEADALLHGLGFRWRLARGLLAYPSLSLSSLPLPPPRSSQGKKTKAAVPAAAAAALPSGALLHVVDDVLPPSLLEELRGAFLDPRAPFWREHGYESPLCGYFSYLSRYQPLPAPSQKANARKSKGKGKSTSNKDGGVPLCANAVDALIHHVVRAVAAAAPEVAARVTHAEWWAHTRPHASGHALHFDTDEQGLREEGELRTPLVSCVLFLADGRDGDAAAAVVGGPTLVLDQRVTVLTEGEEDEEGEEEEQVMMVEPASGSVGAALVYPRTNRLLCFDGRLLHGVIPGRDTGANTAAATTAATPDGPQQQHQRRLTFMVGLWGVDDDDEEEEEDDDEEWCPGPLKRVPFTDARLTWPARLGAAGDWGLGSSTGAEEGEEREGPRVVTAGAAADSGLIVLPRGAWRPVVVGGGKRRQGKVRGSKKRGREGVGGCGDGDGEGVLSPKATYRFVLRGPGEVGEEMAGLVMVDAPLLGMVDGSEEEGEG